MSQQRNPSRPDPDSPPLGERLNDRLFPAMVRYFNFRDMIIGATEVSPGPRRNSRIHKIVLIVALPWLVIDMLLASFFVPATVAIGVKLLLGGLLLPPIVAIGVFWMRQLLECDELQQRIDLLAMATTCIVVVCAVVLFTLLQDMHLALRVPLLAFLWAIVGSYWLTRAWLRHRYR